MQGRHPKWLNIIYFFYVKMYRVLLKVLARKGEKKWYYIQGEEGRLTGPGARDTEEYKGIWAPLPLSPQVTRNEVQRGYKTGKANINRQE